MRFVLIILLAFIKFSGSIRWEGQATTSNTNQVVSTTFGVSGCNAYVSLGVDTTVTNTVQQRKVLLTANINSARASSTAGNKMSFTIFRNGYAITTTADMATLTPRSTSESQSATIVFLDNPPTVGSQVYSLQACGDASLGALGQKRQLSAITVPEAYSPVSSTSSSAIVVQSGVNLLTSTIGVDLPAVSVRSTDVVLLFATVNVHYDYALVSGIFSFSRDGTCLTDSKYLQQAKSNVAGYDRQVSLFYVDQPGDGTYVYGTVAGRTASGAGDTYTVAYAGSTMTHGGAIVLPASQVAFATKTDALLVETPGVWSAVGLDVNTAVTAVADKILLMVNINFNPTTATSQAAFTIFRNGVNLGNSVTGLQVMQTSAIGENAAATMTFLDSPGTIAGVTYSVKMMVIAGSVTVSEWNQTRQLIGMVQQPGDPSAAPTLLPTLAPSSAPSTRQPTLQPSTTSSPVTVKPTAVSTSLLPTGNPVSVKPTVVPTVTPQPSALPTSTPLTNPTYKPTFKPTSPTPNPSLSPTLTPSAKPTPIPLFDCRAGCNVPGPYDIVAGNYIAVMQMPTYFQLQVSVIGLSIPSSGLNNILIINRAADLSCFLGLWINSLGKLTIAYNGDIFETNVLVQTNPFVATNIAFALTVDGILLGTSTNGYTNMFTTNAISLLSTGEEAFLLNGSGDNYPTAGGTLSTLMITPFSARPTAPPSLAPSKNPTVAPTAGLTFPSMTPTRVPTLAPTLPTALPTGPSEAPTEMPTLAPRDCTVKCGPYATLGTYVSQNRLAGSRYILGQNYVVSAQLKPQTLAADDQTFNNMFAVVGDANSTIGVSLDVTNTLATRLHYNGQSFVGPKLHTDYGNVYTRLTITVTPDLVTIVSDQDPNSFQYSVRNAGAPYGTGFLFRLCIGLPNVPTSGGYIANITMAAAPTASPTLAPTTNQPSLAPTGPSLAPTVQPTYAPYDCTTKCGPLALLGGIVYVGKMFGQRFLLSQYFTVKFSIKPIWVPVNDQGFRNMFALVGESNSTRGFALDLMHNLTTRVRYNGQILTYNGPKVHVNHSTVYTRFKVVVSPEQVMIVSDVEPDNAAVFSVRNAGVLNGLNFPYRMYISQIAVPTSGGVIANITIVALPTLSPSLQPSAAPTIAVSDCTHGCGRNDSVIAVSQSRFVCEMILPRMFSLTFSATVMNTDNSNGALNLLDIIDPNSGEGLLSIFISETPGFLVYYRGQLVDGNILLRNGYMTTATKLAIMVTDTAVHIGNELNNLILHYPLAPPGEGGAISVGGGQDQNVGGSAGPSAWVDPSTAGPYYLYTSNGWDYSAGGNLIGLTILPAYPPPSAAPSALPTTAPTATLLDCTIVGMCKTLPGVELGIFQGNRPVQLKMPKYFEMTFKLKIPALPTNTPANVFSIVDSETKVTLLALDVRITSSSRIVYNGIVVSTAGPKVNTDFANTWTTFYLRVDPYFVRAASSNDNMDALGAYSNSGGVNTAGRIYDFYRSDPGYDSVGGVVKDMDITEYVLPPTAVPTATPTAPSAIPTINPTKSPSRSPTVAPTPLPTVLPSLSPSAAPSIAPSAAPTAPSVKPTTAPSVVPPPLSDCSAGCTVTSGPLAISQGNLLARLALPPTFTLTFELLNPAKSPNPDIKCNIFELVEEAADGFNTGKSFLNYFRNEDFSSGLRYNSTLVATYGANICVIGGAWCSVSITVSKQGVIFTSTINSASKLNLPVVDTAKKIYRLYASNLADLSVGGSIRNMVITAITQAPSLAPSARPSTIAPTFTAAPTVNPTAFPSLVPTAAPSAIPTLSPTVDPSLSPSSAPVISPTHRPSATPTATPSQDPSVTPTVNPTLTPIAAPTAGPSHLPTLVPTEGPTLMPSHAPSFQPTLGRTVEPTVVPSITPTAAPSLVPTSEPTVAPTITPTLAPTLVPTAEPSVLPTTTPSAPPSVVPTEGPSAMPSHVPTASPSDTPTVNPSSGPTQGPTLAPSADPSQTPTETPSVAPSAAPSVAPSETPSVAPTAVPSAAPSAGPTAGPSQAPTVAPSAPPSQPPSAAPTVRTTDATGEVVPNVPVAVSFAFTADGSSAELTFDAITNQAGYASSFPCISLLTFTTPQSVSSCQWKDPRTMAIYPRTDASAGVPLLSLGTKVTLMAGKVQAQCSSPYTPAKCATWLATPATALTLAAPLSPALPSISLRLATAEVSRCSPLTLDLSASTGAGGRAWVPPVFTVSVVSNSGNRASAAALQTALNGDASSATSGPFTVDKTVLQSSSDGKYVITATLCNFLGACGTAQASFQFSDSDAVLPVVSIPGTASRNVSVGADLSLSSLAYTINCNGTKSLTGLTYQWQVLQNGAVNADLKSTSTDVTKFKLRAYQLVPGIPYTVQLIVTQVSTAQSVVATVSVTAQSSPLQAVIAGGSAQPISLGNSLTLDASPSSDPDRDPSLTNQLVFVWSCEQIAPVASAACPLATPGSAASSSFKLTALIPDAINTTARVTVTVTDAASRRTSSASVTVRAQDSSLPLISFTTAATAVSNVNTNQRLVLSGAVTVQSPCTAVWSVNDNALNSALATSALAPITTRIPAGAVNKPVTLVLPAAFLPVRAALQFSLQCGSATAAAASLTVTTNGPPLPGAFSVSPPSGTELDTIYTLAASLWSDENLPLNYQFGFLPSGVTALSNALVLQSRSEASYYSSTLGRGSASAEYALTLVLQVFDSLSASSSASQTVTVNPAASTAKAQTALRAQLSAASSSSSPEAVKSVVAVGTVVMNAVSCAHAPNCTLLHRVACGSSSGGVADTCGACLTGYVGPAGSSNTACVLPSGATSSVSTVGRTCSRASDCTGAWESCNTAASPRKCYIPNKSCAAGCVAPQGTCTYKNANTGAVVTPSCLLNDPSCLPVCRCAAGYGGSDCSTSTAEMTTKQSLRQDYVSSFTSVVSNSQDSSSADTVTALSASLGALASSGEELTPASLTLVSTAVDSLLAQAAELQDNAEFSVTAAAPSLLSTIDSTTSSSTTSASTALRQVDALASVLAAQLVAGESAVEYVYDAFRLTTSRQVLGSSTDGGASSLSLSVPLTELEAALRGSTTQPSSAVRFVSTATATAGSRRLSTSTTEEESELALTLIATPAASYDAVLAQQMNSNPLHVAFTHTVSSDSEEGSSAFTTFTLELQHHMAVDFPSEEENRNNNFTSVCDADTADPADWRTYLHTHHCPGSGVVLTHNCSGLHGTLVSYCPALQPSCALVNTADNALVVHDPSVSSIDPATTVCTVVSHTSTATVCSCRVATTVSPSSRRTRRRLQQSSGADGGSSNSGNSGTTSSGNTDLDKSGVLDAVAVSVYLGNQFTDTFQSADDLTSLAALRRTIIVIVMFSTLWTAGFALIFGCIWRRNAMKSANTKSEGKLQRKMQTAQISRSPAAVRQYLSDYVVETFPSVFSNKPFLVRLYGEISRHHRYLLVLTAPEGPQGDKQRIVTGVQLLTVQTMLMFLLALLYDVQGPTNDGTCGTHTDEVTCLHRRSVFDTTQTYCQWTQLGRSYNSVTGVEDATYGCMYKEPVFTLKIVMYIAIIVSILVSIISYPVDEIFELLSAPTADEVKLHQQQEGEGAEADTALKRLGRRASQAARRMSQAAIGAAMAAKGKLVTAGQVLVGTATRQMPASTESAHALAVASMTVIAENTVKLQHQRQIMRMRSYYESGGRFAHLKNESEEHQQKGDNKHERRLVSAYSSNRYDDDGSDIESGSSSSSSDASDNEDYGNVVVRSPEKTVRSGSGSTSATHPSLTASDPSGAASAASPQGNGPRGSNASNASSLTTTASVKAARSFSADIEKTFRRLEEEVACQRRLLKPSEVEIFDAQWGVDPMGEFTRGEGDLIPGLPCFQGKPGARELILAELEAVKKETERKGQKLSVATDGHIGLELIHLFIKDLLGRSTPAAVIFETKSLEDFKHTKVVSKRTKYLAVVALIAVNVFFVYYAMLTGYQRGVNWQRMFLVSCIIQFVCEVFLFETMECVWINCCIPVLVSEEVRSVGQSITEIVTTLCSSGDEGTNNNSTLLNKDDGRFFLSAPEYLYVSNNVAKRFPQLMESILVSNYFSHLPGEISRKWQMGAIAQYSRHQRLRQVGVLTILLTALQYMGTAPFLLHRMMIRFVQPFVFSGLVLLWAFLVSHPVYFSVFGVLLIAFCAYLLYLHQKDKRTALQPLHAAGAEGEFSDGAVSAVPFHDEDDKVEVKKGINSNKKIGGADMADGVHLRQHQQQEGQNKLPSPVGGGGPGKVTVLYSSGKADQLSASDGDQSIHSTAAALPVPPASSHSPRSGGASPLNQRRKQIHFANSSFSSSPFGSSNTLQSVPQAAPPSTLSPVASSHSHHPAVGLGNRDRTSSASTDASCHTVVGMATNMSFTLLGASSGSAAGSSSAVASVASKLRSRTRSRGASYEVQEGDILYEEEEGEDEDHARYRTDSNRFSLRSGRGESVDWLVEGEEEGMYTLDDSESDTHSQLHASPRILNRNTLINANLGAATSALYANRRDRFDSFMSDTMYSIKSLDELDNDNFDDYNDEINDQVTVPQQSRRSSTPVTASNTGTGGGGSNPSSAKLTKTALLAATSTAAATAVPPPVEKNVDHKQPVNPHQPKEEDASIPPPPDSTPPPPAPLADEEVATPSTAITATASPRFLGGGRASRKGMLNSTLLTAGGSSPLRVPRATGQPRRRVPAVAPTTAAAEADPASESSGGSVSDDAVSSSDSQEESSGVGASPRK